MFTALSSYFFFTLVLLSRIGHVSLAETTKKCCCWYSMALSFRLHLTQAQNESGTKAVETKVCQEYRRAPAYDGVPFRRLGRKSTVSSVGNALNTHVDCLLSNAIIHHSCIHSSLAFRGFVLSGFANLRGRPKNENKSV